MKGRLPIRTKDWLTAEDGRFRRWEATHAESIGYCCDDRHDSIYSFLMVLAVERIRNGWFHFLREMDGRANAFQ